MSVKNVTGEFFAFFTKHHFGCILAFPLLTRKTRKIVFKTVIKPIRGVKHRTIQRVSKNCGANFILGNLLQRLLTHKAAWRFEKKCFFSFQRVSFVIVCGVYMLFSRQYPSILKYFTKSQKKGANMSLTAGMSVVPTIFA